MRSLSLTAALVAAFASGAAAGNDPQLVRINEVDADQVSSDSVEFLELFGPGGTSLENLFVVFYNGSSTGDIEYEILDLGGKSIPADGFFVIGNENVENLDYDPSELPLGNAIQNGADAIALWLDTTGALSIADFDGLGPSAAPAGALLVDAFVYDTNDADDTALLAALNLTLQVNEDAGVDSTFDSNQRCPDGGAAFDAASYVQAEPTPGAPNGCGPISAWEDLGSALAGTLGAPVFVGTGELSAGSANSANLRDALGSSPAALFIGIDPNAPAPFKGGTLVPVPVFNVSFAATSATGTIDLAFIWPLGPPSGFNVYAQWAIEDPGAPIGVALSNAIRGTTP